jgi:3'(2'), 5'-bisphosphate nucleotidase
MLDTNNPEIQFLIETTRQAALLVQQVQAKLVGGALTKDDRSPVTVADFACQALVAGLLANSFPEAALVAEEDAQALRAPTAAPLLAQVTRFVAAQIPEANSQQVCDWIERGAAHPLGCFWVLDPIDGTKGFLRHDQYAVALALVVDGQVQLGALGCPKLGQAARPDKSGPGSLVVAARGQGAWVSPLAQPGPFQRLRVSNCRETAQARLLRSVEAGHTNVDQVDEMARRLDVQAQPVRMDSQAKYAVLAAGAGEILVRLLSPDKPHYREKIWDQAAGAIVLEEAGGRISDLDGKVLDFTTGRSLANNRGVLASNGWLHEAALQALREIGA